MTPFHLLPDLTRALYGCCAVALMIGALSLLTAACIWHMERRYIAFRRYSRFCRF